MPRFFRLRGCTLLTCQTSTWNPTIYRRRSCKSAAKRMKKRSESWCFPRLPGCFFCLSGYAFPPFVWRRRSSLSRRLGIVPSPSPAQSAAMRPLPNARRACSDCCSASARAAASRLRNTTKNPGFTKPGFFFCYHLRRTSLAIRKSTKTVNAVLIIVTKILMPSYISRAPALAWIDSFISAFRRKVNLLFAWMAQKIPSDKIGWDFACWFSLD